MSLSSVKVIRATVLSTILLSILAALSLALPRISPVSAGVNVCTWTGSGADNNWSTAANWTCDNGTVPADGYELVFPRTASSETLNNDIIDIELTGIMFTGDCTESNQAYTISGARIFMAGDISQDDVTSGCFGVYDRLDLDITLLSSVTVTGGSFSEGGGSQGVVIGPDSDGSTKTLSVGTHNLNIVRGSISSNLTGSGVINISGHDSVTGNYYYSSAGGDNSGFTGSIIATDVIITASRGHTFPSTMTSLTIGETASLELVGPGLNGVGNEVYGSDLIVEGARASGVNSKLLFSTSPNLSVVAGADEYLKHLTAGLFIEWSGDITLNDTVFAHVTAEQVSFTGALSGLGNSILLDSTAGGTLTVNATSNNTDLSNGVYQSDLVETTLSDISATQSIHVGPRNKVYVTGQRGDVLLEYGGILGGTGTVGNIESIGGVLQPGLSPGVMQTGSLDFDSDTVLDIEIGGTALGEYDQLDVTGTVSLGGATLNTSFWDGFVPSQNDEFIIIQNDGTDAVTGTFAGLAEGATFIVGDVTFQISYVGGTGNDVVLTVTDSPGPPDTGFMTLQASTLLPILAMVSGASALGVRRLSGLKSRKNKK